MNTEMFLFIQALMYTALFMFTVLLLMLGFAALIDLLFGTKLIKRVECLIFDYEEELN